MGGQGIVIPSSTPCPFFYARLVWGRIPIRIPVRKTLLAKMGAAASTQGPLQRARKIITIRAYNTRPANEVNFFNNVVVWFFKVSNNMM
jgi:hypothetical protein